MRDERTTRVTMEEQFNHEKAAQVKLNELYRALSEEASKKVSGLTVALDTAKSELAELSDKYADETNRHNDDVAHYNEQIESLNKRIVELEDRLSQVGQVPPPVPAPVSPGKTSVVEAYTLYVQTREALRAKESEVNEMRSFVTHVVSEIERKAPEIARQHNEFVRATQEKYVMYASDDHMQ